MTFDDLRKNHTKEELSVFPGDNELRFQLFSPVFRNLFESKVVYYEKFICIARLDDVQITPERFSATAVPILHIKRTVDDRLRTPAKPWNFGGTWSWMTLVNHGIKMLYAGWMIWPEAERVREVERLASAGQFKAALRMTFDENEVT